MILVIFCFFGWIIHLTKIPKQKESFYILPETSMPIQKVFLIYTFGHTSIVSWKKRFNLNVELKPKLETDLCGYYGYFSESNIVVFSADGFENASYVESYHQLLQGQNLPIHSYSNSSKRSGPYRAAIPNKFCQTPRPESLAKMIANPFPSKKCYCISDKDLDLELQ